MDETRVVLAGLWVALMLTYLLGDVLRILAGLCRPTHGDVLIDERPPSEALSRREIGVVKGSAGYRVPLRDPARF